MDLQEIVSNFEMLDDWEDRYGYLIELGRGLEPLEAEAHNEANKVRGCASQVWLQTSIEADAEGNRRLFFKGDSDAHLVRGLIALALATYSGKVASEIVATDMQPLMKTLGFAEHLTPQRSNGFRSMVERIRNDAKSCMADG